MGKTKLKKIDSTKEVKEPKEPKNLKADKTTLSKKTQKKSQNQPKTRSKKYQKVKSLVDANKKYSLGEAVELVQKVSFVKFPATIEAHLNANVKSLRGLVSLPYSVGKKLIILAFGSGAKEAGADIVGDDTTIETISKGQLDKIGADVIVTTAEWMPKLARVAKVLGPRGLMPNPKSGTITENLLKTITELQAGKTEYKTEANGQVVHLGIGKVSQPKEEIAANIKALVNGIGKSKISKITLSPTMGPGIKVDLGTI